MMRMLSDAEVRHLEGKAVLAAKYLSLYERSASKVPALSASYYRKSALFLREVVADGRLALPTEALNEATSSLLCDTLMDWALVNERARAFPVLHELMQRLSRKTVS